MCEPGLQIEETLIQKFGLEGAILDLVMIHDTQFFLTHPLSNEYFRSAFPTEVERLYPDEVDINSDDFRVRVVKIDQDTYMRDFFERQHGKLTQIGMNLSTYPTGGVLKLLEESNEGVDER